MWISPKPMVDGFVKIFGEFRNGCDEKSVTFSRHFCQADEGELPEAQLSLIVNRGFRGSILPYNPVENEVSILQIQVSSPQGKC